MAITYKALLVGNADFPDDPHNLMSLRGPLNDVRLLEQALCDGEKGFYAEKNIEALTNAASREIMLKLEAFFTHAGRDDQLLFYYSGHGYTNVMNQLFLCANDTNTDALVSTAIADSSIDAMIQNSASQKIVIILDCCNSGNFKGGGLPQNLKGKGRFVLTSSQAGQLSSDTKDDSGPSPFTKYLLEALLDDGVDVNNDGFIGINEVYEYLFPKLKAETKQIPHRHFDNTVGDLPMGKRKAAPSQIKKGTNEPESNTIILGSGKARLGISESSIELRAIQPDEVLPDEIIDVFNEGAGELDWEANTNCDWIELERSGTFIKIKLKPKQGINRGTIHVSDRNSGSSRTIRLFVEKLKEPTIPKPDPVPHTNQTKASDPRAQLQVFDDVSMRFPENAKAIVDQNEQHGQLKVFADRMQFLGKWQFVISHIQSITYLPQANYPGNIQNYMAVTGLCKDRVQTFYFYTFSWVRQNSTLIMAENILGMVDSGQLKVVEEFQQIHPPETPAAKRLYLPGQWNMYINQFGQQIAVLQLNLIENGILNGTQQASTGFSQINGQWCYNEFTMIFQYNVMVNSYGQLIPDQGSVRLTVAKDGSISGFDNQGRQWVLQRI